MTNTTNIRLRKDGSIDTTYYMARARVQRSEAAHDAVRDVTRGTLKTIGVLAVFAVVLPFLGSQS